MLIIHGFPSDIAALRVCVHLHHTRSSLSDIFSHFIPHYFIMFRSIVIPSDIKLIYFFFKKGDFVVLNNLFE